MIFSVVKIHYQRSNKILKVFGYNVIAVQALLFPRIYIDVTSKYHNYSFNAKPLSVSEAIWLSNHCCFSTIGNECNVAAT